MTTYQQPLTAKRSNGLGTAGFVVALIGAVLSLMPITSYFAIFLAVVGLGLALPGAFRKHTTRALAYAGLILGTVALVLGIVGAVQLNRAVDQVNNDINQLQQQITDPDPNDPCTEVPGLTDAQYNARVAACNAEISQYNDSIPPTTAGG